MAKNIGYTDSPVTKDLFEIERYKKGLINFISRCNTPMTIAIQGDWGSGKTSMMEMIKGGLPEDIQTVWFNTWQYSQFNMGDELPIFFLSAICQKLQIKDKDKKNHLMKAVGIVGSGVRTMTLATVDALVGGRVADLAEKVGDAVTGKDDIKDPAVEIENLKYLFEAAIESVCDEEGRVVFFIDDLDRLVPSKAVELLEVLKLFLDSKHCVFVLAIDYGVVQRGVKDKYGTDFDDEKARSFFDKIIQVPFKMPVADYKINMFVDKCFEDIGITGLSKEVLASYVDLIELSIGSNPRSMKRLFNSYLLLTDIAQQKLIENEESRRLLFALLCLQSRFEKVYDYLIGNRDDINADQINDLRKADNELFINLDMDEKEISVFTSFAEALVGIIDKDNSGEVDDIEIEPFKEVLSFSAITANGNSNTGKGKRAVPQPVTGVDALDFKYPGDDKKGKLAVLIGDIRKCLHTDEFPELKQYPDHFDVVFSVSERPLFMIILKERKAGFSVEFYGDKVVFDKSEFVDGFMTERSLKYIQYGGKNKQYFQYTIADGNNKDLDDMHKLIEAFLDTLGRIV